MPRSRHGFVRLGGLGLVQPRRPVTTSPATPWPAPGAPVGSATLLSTVQMPVTAPYMAFTDLCFVPTIGPYGCLFAVWREGTSHVSRNGKIRVMACPDGVNWVSVALLSSPWSAYPDLRDPKIDIAEDGSLRIFCGGLSGTDHIQSAVFFSADGHTWDGGTQIGPLDRWLWRPKRIGSTTYAVGYATTPGQTDAQAAVENLYSSADGLNPWTLVAADFVPRQGNEVSNEAALEFQANGDAVCVTRSENGAVWCHLLTASAPYTTWSNRITDVTTPFPFLPTIQSPVLLVLPDGRIVASGRFQINVRVAIALVDPAGHVTPLLNLTPNVAGNDAGYPGLAWVNDLLYVSGYSDHASHGTPSIYVWTIQLPPA